jgi:cytochrome b subunit of formate dehydrogenase
MRPKLLILLSVVLSVFFLGVVPEITLASDPQNCLFCHKYKRLRVYDEEGSLKDYYVDTRLFHQSIHRAVTCVGCHSDVTKVPHGETEKVDCSKVCHMDRYETMAGQNFSHRDVAETVRESVHGVKPDDSPEVAQLKPDCKYCHLNDLYALPEEVPSDEVLKRCLNCHQEKGLQDIFMHISHRFKHKTSRPPMEIVELCATCHADKDFHNVMGFNEAQAEAVDTYKETIHYRILQFGGNDTAQCVDCHASESIHDIRPPSDPLSSIHVDNRFDTCNAGECHPGASPTISAVDSHLSKQKDKGPEIHIAELIMEGVMFVTLFFLFTLMSMETYRRLRNRDARFFRWLRRPQSLNLDSVKAKAQSALGSIANLHRYVTFSPKGDYPRYSIHIVINHTLMAIAFTASVVTGLPLFFHNAELSHKVVALMGGIDMTRLIHRVSAIVFTFDCAYHVLVILCGTASRTLKGTFDIRRTQFPLFKDLKDLYNDFLYFLGLRKTRPRMEKFMYKQKIHYLAMVWGCSVLTLSGLCLLYPEFMVEYLPFPKVSFNILRLMHAEESVLAFLVITLWHLYNVHIAPGRFPAQWTFLNGKINRDHQIEEHFLEYERQVREGVVPCEEEKLLTSKPEEKSIPVLKKSTIEAFIVFIIVLALAASTSAYLTFKVQFVRKSQPVQKAAELSYQTLRVKDQERQQKHEHFHLTTEDINLEAWAELDSCILCHSPYPHGKESKAKALMNLHTEFLTCQSCHIKIEEGEKIKFDWINPTGHSPEGTPYGTKLDPATGFFADTDDHYSKLTPVRMVDGVWETVRPQTAEDINLQPGIDYLYMEKWRKFHKGTELEEFVTCTSCHSPDGIMDFRALGFEPARVNQLEKLEVGGMFTNYETFYFPDLFREKF